MSVLGFGASTMVVPQGWTAAYARLHQDGVAQFPPACLYYVMNVVRHASQGIDLLAEPQGSRSVSPSSVIAAFRSAVRSDFGPLRHDVLEDWGLRTPADLGVAVSLLGRAGTLKLDEGDAPEFYAADETSFAEDVP